MSERKDIEDLFIREELDQHGEFLSDLLTDAINDKELIKTERLLGGINYQVTKRGSNMVLSFSFPAYGRLIEIAYFRQRRNAIAELRKNVDVWNRKQKARQKRRKDTRWYAKNVYGSQNRLIGHLAYGLTNIEMQRLKQMLINSIASGNYAKWQAVNVSGSTVPTTHYE